MITYTFEARDPSSGQKITSQVQAENERAAAKAIKDQGLSPLSITTDEPTGLKRKLLSRIATKDKVIFSRQLSTLINAGLPLVQSLRTVEGQTTNKVFKTVISKVIASVEAGTTLADSLSKHPKVFNNVYISLVAAGEASGTLDKTLERLADQQEKDAETMGKVRGALIYPALVIVVMIGVVVFMLTTVLPHVEELYSGIPGAKLPFITTLLLGISHIMTRFWWLLLVVLGVAGFYGSRWARTGPGQEAVDRAKMHAWPLGKLYMKMYMARFARTAQTLVASGVPLLQVLNITGEAIGNVHIKRSLSKAADKVKGGKNLSESLQGDPNFLDLVPNMIQIGEQSGALETMLDKTADYFEKEVDNEIKTISTLIEPILMIAMGVAALIIVAAVLLPIYGLVGKFQT